MIERLRKISQASKILIIIIVTIIIGVFSCNKWFKHILFDGPARIDWEWVTLLMGLTVLILYSLFFGFYKKDHK